MSDNETLFQSIRDLVERLQSLNRQAVRKYTPVVEIILRSRSRNIRHIEHTLDGLLDFCGYDPALVSSRGSAATIGKLIRRRRPAMSTFTAKWGIRKKMRTHRDPDVLAPPFGVSKPDGGTISGTMYSWSWLTRKRFSPALFFPVVQ